MFFLVHINFRKFYSMATDIIEIASCWLYSGLINVLIHAQLPLSLLNMKTHTHTHIKMAM